MNALEMLPYMLPAIMAAKWFGVALANRMAARITRKTIR